MIVSDITQDGLLITNLKPRSEKKILVNCEYCQKERFVSMCNLTTSRLKRDDNKTPCIKCSSRFETGPKNKNRPAWNKGIKGPVGIDHPSWKGGTYVSSDGYRMIKTNDNSGWKAYQKEHKVVIEKLIERPLKKGEVIHHINGNKLDNQIENLQLCLSDSKHRDAHNSLEKIGFQLVQLGLIQFDKINNLYSLAHVKLRELLEPPIQDNQQPSLDSNVSEGSTTRCESFIG